MIECDREVEGPASPTCDSAYLGDIPRGVANLRQSSRGFVESGSRREIGLKLRIVHFAVRVPLFCQSGVRTGEGIGDAPHVLTVRCRIAAFPISFGIRPRSIFVGHLGHLATPRAIAKKRSYL